MPKETSSLEERCLDFANTVHWHASAQPEEKIHSYQDLLIWAEGMGVITPIASLQLAEAAQAQLDTSQATLKRALALREAIYRVFAAHVHEQGIEESDLTLINEEIASASSHAQLSASEEGFVWGWDSETQLDAVIWPIVRSAADLLTSEELLPRVGQCADDRGCGWLFLDMSKNHSRRWCDINDCGNRAKQRRHYARARGETKDEGQKTKA